MTVANWSQRVKMKQIQHGSSETWNDSSVLSGSGAQVYPHPSGKTSGSICSKPIIASPPTKFPIRPDTR
ncbi:hypothetical protein MARINON1_40260 [Marinobacter salarius]|nr:hypothetical protein MBHK15_70121 [Marinobacter salarius]VXB23513.1 hypothetical protein MARINON1_40260 [Marinobacter salarius]